MKSSTIVTSVGDDNSPSASVHETMIIMNSVYLLRSSFIVDECGESV